jgi:hypothetical protein
MLVVQTGGKSCRLHDELIGISRKQTQTTRIELIIHIYIGLSIDED